MKALIGMDNIAIDYLGIERVLQRGTGTILEQRNDALLVRDSVSGAYLLACGDVGLGISLLDKHISRECNLLMVSNVLLGRRAYEKYGFAEKLECYQVAYYGEAPAIDTRISVRTATKSDLALLVETYHLISPEEMEIVISREALLLGYVQNQLVGFIGEHLEGSMGLLYVFPEFRRQGFATELEKIYIAKTMEQGYVPFGQVEKNNKESLALQKKLGMTQSQNLICWMWK